MSLLVFGQTGQVAQELKRLRPTAHFIGRDEADLSDPKSCTNAIHKAHPTAVINAAAYTVVDKAEDDESLAAVVNGAAPGAMAEACAKLDIPFIHISTDYVFDGAGLQAFAPDHPTKPLSAYGRTKLLGEEAVRSAKGRYGILRTSWVFSAHGANFVKTMLRLGVERDRLTIVADQIGGPTPASGIAQTCLTMAVALANDAGAAGIYHYAGAPDVSWADFARAIFDEANLDVEVEDIPTTAYPTPAQRPLNSRLDCASLTAQFGIIRPDWRAHVSDVIKELSL